MSGLTIEENRVWQDLRDSGLHMKPGFIREVVCACTIRPCPLQTAASSAAISRVPYNVNKMLSTGAAGSARWTHSRTLTRKSRVPAGALQRLSRHLPWLLAGRCWHVAGPRRRRAAFAPEPPCEGQIRPAGLLLHRGSPSAALGPPIPLCLKVWNAAHVLPICSRGRCLVMQVDEIVDMSQAAEFRQGAINHR